MGQHERMLTIFAFSAPIRPFFRQSVIFELSILGLFIFSVFNIWPIVIESIRAWYGRSKLQKAETIRSKHVRGRKIRTNTKKMKGVFFAFWARYERPKLKRTKKLKRLKNSADLKKN